MEMDSYKSSIFTDVFSDNWFYQKYYLEGENKRYYTFQLALNLLKQMKVKPVILETGCQRELNLSTGLGDGLSTSVFGEYCKRNEGTLLTIDSF